MGDNSQEIIEKIKTMEFKCEGKAWENVSPEAIDLVNSMLCPREKRVSASEVLEHPWMSAKPEVGKLHLLNVSSLKDFFNGEKLKKFTLSLLASQSSEKNLRHLSQLFLKLDSDNDGQISYKDLEEALKTSGKTKELEELRLILSSTGTNNEQKFNYNRNLHIRSNHHILL